MIPHKIIYGNPRCGTNFITKWYANEYPKHKPLSEKFGFAHFSPHYDGWPDIHDKEGIDQETKLRIKNDLSQPSIFKVHPGPDMSKHIFDYIFKMPVILVKRKDVLGQFLSYGLGFTTKLWVNYESKLKFDYMLKAKEKFTYKKEWFDDLASRLKELEKKQRNLNIEKLVWFEDIPNLKVNGKLPEKLNSFSNRKKLTFLNNSDEFMDWFLNFYSNFEMKEKNENYF